VANFSVGVNCVLQERFARAAAFFAKLSEYEAWGLGDSSLSEKERPLPGTLKKLAEEIAPRLPTGP